MGPERAQKKPWKFYYKTSRAFCLAAGEGFEPSQTESESVVLPLHNPAILFEALTPSALSIIPAFARMSTPFMKKYEFFWRRPNLLFSLRNDEEPMLLQKSVATEQIVCGDIQ